MSKTTFSTVRRDLGSVTAWLFLSLLLHGGLLALVVAMAPVMRFEVFPEYDLSVDVEVAEAPIVEDPVEPEPEPEEEEPEPEEEEPEPAPEPRRLELLTAEADDDETAQYEITTGEDRGGIQSSGGGEGAGGDSGQGGSGTGGRGRDCPATDAEPLRRPQAEYPVRARRRGIEGTVVALLNIDERGEVVGVRIIDGPGYGLDEAAEAIFWEWTFEPATRNCEPVSSRERISHVFSLN